MGSAPKPWEAAPAPWGGAEIEELPAQPVLARGRGRPGLTVAGAVGVLAIVLAAGSGVLGGGRTAVPTSPALAAASAPTPGAPPSAAPPLVIPAVPCLPMARALPEVRLVVGSDGISGAERIYEWTQTGAEAAPAMVLHDPTVAGRTELRSDVLAELRTVDDSCASAWNIELANRGEAIALENFGVALGEEGLGTQNRFALDLGRYRGHDYDLQAHLTFPGVTVRTTWPIRVLPFAAPSAKLTVGDRKLDIVPGCDVQLVLGTGYTELADPCFADLDRLPNTASIRRPGPPLIFRFPADWVIEGPTVVCGRIDAQRFGEDPSCVVGWSYERTSLSILDPTGTEDGDDGPWTLAINVCGTEVLNDATNAACGTWYATIEPRAPAK